MRPAIASLHPVVDALESAAALDPAGTKATTGQPAYDVRESDGRIEVRLQRRRD